MGDKIWLKVAIDEHKMRKIVKNNLHRQHYNRLKKKCSKLSIKVEKIIDISQNYAKIPKNE